jgi:hypothetical protein
LLKLSPDKDFIDIMRTIPFEKGVKILTKDFEISPAIQANIITNLTKEPYI